MEIEGLCAVTGDPPIKILLTVDDNGTRRVLACLADAPLNFEQAAAVILSGNYEDVTEDFPAP
jgi:hypothetical protein